MSVVKRLGNPFLRQPTLFLLAEQNSIFFSLEQELIPPGQETETKYPGCVCVCVCDTNETKVFGFTFRLLGQNTQRGIPGREQGMTRQLQNSHLKIFNFEKDTFPASLPTSLWPNSRDTLAHTHIRR